MKALDESILVSGTVCLITEEISFAKRMQTKPKGVTIQMKALDESILMVLFVLLLKRVHFLVKET